MFLRPAALAVLPMLFGQPQDAQEPRAPERSPMSPPVRVVLPDAGVTVPLVPRRRLPTVEVYFGEAGPFHLIVEWAGNFLAVSEDVQKKAGLEVIARSPRGTDRVAVPGLSVGAADFEGLVADVHPFFSRTDHDGALGLNVFQTIVGTLDFPKQELRLSKTFLADPKKDPTVVGYSPGPGGTPRIPIELGGKVHQAVLDTAAEAPLIIDDRLLEELPIAGELRPGPTIMTPAMGQVQAQEGRVAGELVIGPVRTKEPLAIFHRMMEPEILLGGGFLRDYALTLDQKNRRLRLTQADAKKR